MKERVLPQAEHNIISPYDDTPILEFYKGYYDCVYIILHPFIKVDDDKIDFTSWWPARALISQHTQKTSWAEFISLSGIENIKRLDIALKNHTGVLDEEYRNGKELEIFNQTRRIHHLIDPPAGFFQELLIGDMMKAVQEAGHEWIFIGDEFGKRRNLEYIQDIIDDKIELTYLRENWYTPKNEILYSVHTDSHFTLLCSDRPIIEKMLLKYPFEGFYCDEKTNMRWSLK
jgi:hypothetical protein